MSAGSYGDYSGGSATSAADVAAAVALQAEIAEAEARNQKMGRAIPYGQVVFLGLFAAWMLPRLVRSARSGRLASGWYLRKSSSPSRAAGGGLSRNASAASPPSSLTRLRSVGATAPAPQTNSWPVVTSQTLYNRFMLYTVPLLGLTVGQLGVLALYSGLVSGAAAWKVGNWEVNGRRFGFIALGQIPAIFLLAMKNSPVFWLTGKGYEKLNFLHRFAGRLLVLFAVIHGSSMYYTMNKAMGTIKLTGHVETGTVAMIFASILFITSLKPIRDYFYQAFLALHIAGYIGLIVALWYHYDATHPYIYVAIVALCIDHISKMLKTRVRRATIAATQGGLTRVEIDGLGDGWRAGQHVCVRLMKGGRALEKHPFTIANAPGDSGFEHPDGPLVLVAKATGGLTRSLHRTASAGSGRTEKGTRGASNRVLVTVEGPYGGHGLHDFTHHESVLLVAGGIGFTYTMSTLEEIIGYKASGRAVTKRVTVVWVLRDLGMLEAFLGHIPPAMQAAESVNLVVDFRIHDTSVTAHNYQTLPGVHWYDGRPHVESILGESLDTTMNAVNSRGAARGSGVGFGVCGPAPLVASCRTATARVAWNDAQRVGGIFFHSEMFGW